MLNTILILNFKTVFFKVFASLEKAKEINATYVVLKENSPSCGSTMIYNGEFNGTKMAGNGVAAALLRRHGFKVISEEQFSEILEEFENKKADC